MPRGVPQDKHPRFPPNKISPRYTDIEVPSIETSKIEFCSAPVWKWERLSYLRYIRVKCMNAVQHIQVKVVKCTIRYLSDQDLVFLKLVIFTWKIDCIAYQFSISSPPPTSLFWYPISTTNSCPYDGVFLLGGIRRLAGSHWQHKFTFKKAVREGSWIFYKKNQDSFCWTKVCNALSTHSYLNTVSYSYTGLSVIPEFAHTYRTENFSPAQK